MLRNIVSTNMIVLIDQTFAFIVTYVGDIAEVAAILLGTLAPVAPVVLCARVFIYVCEYVYVCVLLPVCVCVF